MEALVRPFCPGRWLWAWARALLFRFFSKAHSWTPCLVRHWARAVWRVVNFKFLMFRTAFWAFAPTSLCLLRGSLWQLGPFWVLATAVVYVPILVSGIAFIFMYNVIIWSFLFEI